MSDLLITLVRSPIGSVPKHRSTVKALGLRKLNQTVQRADTPQLRGMIEQVSHMVTVRGADGTES